MEGILDLLSYYGRMREVDVIACSKEEVTRKEKEKRGAERKGDEKRGEERRKGGGEERRSEKKREKRKEERRVPPDSCTSTGGFVSDSSVSIGGGGADRYPYPVWAGLVLHPHSHLPGTATPQLPQTVAVRKHRSFLTFHAQLVR